MVTKNLLVAIILSPPAPHWWWLKPFQLPCCVIPSYKTKGVYSISY
jgi:hypothetical protein